MHPIALGEEIWPEVLFVTSLVGTFPEEPYSFFPFRLITSWTDYTVFLRMIDNDR